VKESSIYLGLVMPARRKLKAGARNYACAGGRSWRRVTRQVVDDVMEESKKVEAGIRNDEDLNRVREAHAKLGCDIKQGLVEAGLEAQTDMQVGIEQATWFWQDLFRVYLPRIMSKMRDIPIPRLVLPDGLVLSYTHLQIKQNRVQGQQDRIRPRESRMFLPLLSFLPMSTFAISLIWIFKPRPLLPRLLAPVSEH